MPTRFDIERALERSGLPHKARAIGFALCRRMTAGGTDIPAEFSPSLQKLSRVTGISLRSIKRHLNLLERRGWVIRDRPSLHDARTLHVTTRYTVTVPPGQAVLEAAGGPAEAAEIALVVDELERRTGTVVPIEWAAKIRAELLARPGIRKPAAWIRTCIRGEPDPRRWLPTQLPPPRAEIERREELATKGPPS